MQDVFEEKRSCRKAMRRLLAAQERSEAMEKSNAASLALISLDAFKRANIVMAYMAMKHECNPEFAVKTAIELGKTVVFPRCIENGGLELYAASRPEDFSVGAYGILEPIPERCRLVSPAELDFIIVPGVCFSKKSVRLGQGGGYYDRLLSSTPAFKCGFCFDFQVMDDVPHEAHDAVCDCVTTNGFTVFS